MPKYTFEEIKRINPAGLRRYLSSPQRSAAAHPPVTSEREFPEHDAAVFAAIVGEIEKANPTQVSLKAWAIGSRVNGRWRTREESESLAAEGYRLKYSDYDVATNARVLPQREALRTAMEPFGETAHVVRGLPRPPQDVVSLGVGSWWSRCTKAMLEWLGKPRPQ